MCQVKVYSNNKMIDSAMKKNKKIFANYNLWFKAGEVDCPDSLKDLINNEGADVNFSDELGYTPLMHALYKGRMKNVQFLLSVKANIFIHTKTGDTVFSIAETQQQDLVKVLEKSLTNRIFPIMRNAFVKTEEPNPLKKNLKNDIRERMSIAYANYLIKKKNKKSVGDNWYEITQSNLLKNGYTKVDLQEKSIAIKDEILNAALEELEMFELKISACISQLENEESNEVQEDELERGRATTEEDPGSEEGKGKDDSGEIEETIEKMFDYRQKNIFFNIIETLALEGNNLGTEAKEACKSFLTDSSCITNEDVITAVKIRGKLFHLPLKILEKNSINYFFKKPWEDVSKFLITYLKRIDKILKTDETFLEPYNSLENILQRLDITQERNLPDFTENSMEFYLKEIINSSYEDDVTEETKFHFLVNFYPFFNSGNIKGTIIGKQFSTLRNKIIHEFHTHDSEDFNRYMIRLREMMFLYVYCHKISESLQDSLNNSLKISFKSFKEELYQKMQKFNDTFQCCYYIPEDELHFGLERNEKVDWECGKKGVEECVYIYIKRHIFSEMFKKCNKIKRNTIKEFDCRINKYLREWKKFKASKLNKNAISNVLNTIKILLSVRDTISIRTSLSLYEDYLVNVPGFEERLINMNLSPNLFDAIPRNTTVKFSYKGLKEEKKCILLVGNIMSYFRAHYSCTLSFDSLKDAFNNEVVLDYLVKFFEKKEPKEHEKTVFMLIKMIESWEIVVPFVAKLIVQNSYNLTEWEETLERIVETLVTGNNGGYLHHINALIENMKAGQDKAFVNLIIKIITQKRMPVKDFIPLLENLKTSSLILEVLSEKLDTETEDNAFSLDLTKKIIFRYSGILKNLDPCVWKEASLQYVVTIIKTKLLPLCEKMMALEILRMPSYVAEIELTLAWLLLNLAERNKSEKDWCTEVPNILEKYRNLLDNKDLDLLRVAILAQAHFQLEEYKECAETLSSLTLKIKKRLYSFKKMNKCYSLTNVKELYKIWIDKLTIVSPIYQKFFKEIEILKKIAAARLRQGLKERSLELINDAVKKYRLAFLMSVSENGEQNVGTMQIRYLLAKSLTIKGFFLQAMENSSLYNHHEAMILSYKIFEHFKLNVGLYDPKISHCYQIISHNLLGLCWEFSHRREPVEAALLFYDIYFSDFSRFLIPLIKTVIIIHDVTLEEGYCTINDVNLPSSLHLNTEIEKLVRDRYEYDGWTVPRILQIERTYDKDIVSYYLLPDWGFKPWMCNFTIVVFNTNTGGCPENIKEMHTKWLWEFINNFLEPKDYFY